MPPTDGKYFYADMRSGNRYGMHIFDTIQNETEKSLDMWMTSN
jgi:hypothetical protein